MKESFQSKDLQAILGVEKQRVEYLGMKIPIPPDVETADRSGQIHRYSLGRTLMFAIAQTASEFGLNMTEIRKTLMALNEFAIHGDENKGKFMFYIQSGALIFGPETELFPAVKGCLATPKILRDYFTLPENKDSLFVVISPGEGLTIYPITRADGLGDFLKRYEGVAVLNLKAIKGRVLKHAT